MLLGLAFIAVSLLVFWLVFIALVFLVRPDDIALRDAVRLLPDTLRLVRRLAGDRTIPAGTRWMVWLVLAYLVSPIDLVPDVVPVIGFADDAIISSFVLRHIVRRAGPGKLQEHWPGSSEGLAALARLLRLPDSR